MLFKLTIYIAELYKCKYIELFKLLNIINELFKCHILCYLHVNLPQDVDKNWVRLNIFKMLCHTKDVLLYTHTALKHN